MIRCKDCRYWGNVGRHAKKGYRKCLKIGDYPDNRQYNIIAVDYEDYDAWVETTPNFGCVNGEAK